MANARFALEDLKICHVNCQSLLAHFDEFNSFFSDSGYHIICMSETWLKSSIPDSMVRLPGFSLVRCDRLGRIGGGVGIYCLDTLGVSILEHSDGAGDGRPEYIIAEIILQGSSRLLLTTVYRPPNAGYLQEFSNLFLERQVGYKHSVILGDFNADMNESTYDSRSIKTFVLSSGLFLVPYQATHHLKNSSTLLDLCIVDDLTKVKEYGQHDVSFLSAHDLIFIKYDIRIQRRIRRLITCRDFKNFNENLLLEDILNSDWSALLSSNCIDEKISILNSQLLHFFNKYAPLRRVLFRNLPAPWLTEEIRAEMRARDLARRAWRRSRSSLHYKEFRILRNRVQARVRLAKRSYYQEAFTHGGSAVSVWSKLRHLGLVKTRGDAGGLICPADDLNKFFIQTSGESEMDVSVDEGVPAINNLLNVEFDDNSLHWNYVTPLTIRRILHGNGSGAIGNDGISLKMIKLALPCIMPVIEHLFNFSLSRGTFPESWKMALVCPIPKIRNPTEVQHYRPISILPAMSKALERVVCDQICHYLSDHNLLDPRQSAYRQHNSTQTCLIRMLDEVRQAADNRMVTISVFFDLSKAFDRVQHVTLIEKLKSLNFSETVLRWIYSYLTGRSQAVRDRVNDYLTPPTLVRMGVPQGSVLGPLLFTLYLSDFRHMLRYCEYNLYADDLQIYHHCKSQDLADTVNRVNSDIISILTWATSNKLLLNANKTQSIIMGTSRYINAIDLTSVPKITVAGVDVTYSAHVKYLGVWIANNLSWNLQVSHITNKVRSTLYQLKLCRHLIPDTLKIKLVVSLIYPHIDYCCAILTDITAELNLKLYRAMNACMRFIFGIRIDEHISPYYTRLRWLKVEKRREYLVACLLFNILKYQQPDLLYRLFSIKVCSSSRSMRSANDLLSVPQCRTELYRRSYRLSAIRLWNRLPLDLRNESSSVVFKNGLYAHLLDLTAEV